MELQSQMACCMGPAAFSHSFDARRRLRPRACRGAVWRALESWLHFLSTWWFKREATTACEVGMVCWRPQCAISRPARPVSEYGRCLFLPVKVAALPVLCFAPLGLARSSLDLRNFICLSPVVIRCGTKSNVRKCSACALVDRCNECQICVAYEHTNMSCLGKMISV